MKSIRAAKDLPTYAHEAILVFSTTYGKYYATETTQYLTFESDIDMKSWIRSNPDKDFRVISANPKHVNVTVSIT